MVAYYNENDKFAAQWLRNLIGTGLIAPGDVDERSIVDVRPDDLVGYAQCHFFAGIGGWSYALRLAGWPDDEPVWTGSCPCQPLSVAGQQRGHADERHLWPAFYNLIAERKPSVCFGEQVASKIGREWLAGVRADLEGAGYACGAADLCAAGVGAPHRRQRLYWVAMADAGGAARQWHARGVSGAQTEIRREDGAQHGDMSERPYDGHDRSGAMEHPDGGRRARGRGREIQGGREANNAASPDQGGGSFWSDSEWIACADGKARRAKRGIRLLVNGPTENLGRVGRWRGYGNCIVPQVAQAFISAFLEAA